MNDEREQCHNRGHFNYHEMLDGLNDRIAPNATPMLSKPEMGFPGTPEKAINIMEGGYFRSPLVMQNQLPYRSHKGSTTVD